eukprot:1374675-Amorphochlora_amoeboformis.AAC.2
MPAPATAAPMVARRPAATWMPEATWLEEKAIERRATTSTALRQADPMRRYFLMPDLGVDSCWGGQTIKEPKEEYSPRFSKGY